MSSLAQALETPIQSESVTTISAIARVDYILRFSKQAVMVVDEQIALCSNVGSQFLSNLSSDHNAAYITMSAKLNDLQVRCRIIEQLFGNTLFDPEQSLAVSLINLAKKHQQPVSIVIDNAHLLSLQLTHELCQLAEVAKKSDQSMSILMLSTPQGGLKICQNQSLFQKKLAIISAKSGQLISHNSKLFKPVKNYLAITPMKKWMAFFLVFALIAAGSVYLLFKRDVFGFSVALKQAAESQPIAISNKEPAPETFVKVSGNEDERLLGENQASTNEIFTSLVTSSQDNPVVLEKAPEKAKPIDIMNALEAFTKMSDAIPVNNTIESQELIIEPSLEVQVEQLTISSDNITEFSEEKVDSIATSQVIADPITSNVNENIDLSTQSSAQELILQSAPASLMTEEHFQDQQQGFVIQIAGFTQQNVLDEFLADFQSLTLFQYKRLVNNETMTILTTEYYLNREQAEQAFVQLPQAIKNRSPWIKAISAINDEINYFQRSQSGENQVTIPAS